MSLFARVWNYIRRPTGYVGKDLQGNYFYEYSSRLGGRSRRVVKYRGQTDTLAVAERSRQLAVQWKAWLTHTRLNPPTLAELQADKLRLERLRQNVALIEAREQGERLRLSASSEGLASRYGNTEQAALIPPPHRSDVASAPSNASARVEPKLQLDTNVRNQRWRTEKQYDHDPWVSPPTSEPQSWAPKSIHRGE